MASPDIDQETLRRAVEDDDHDAMRDVLHTCNVPSSAIEKCMRGLRRGRVRDHAEFEKRVAARIHYIKRGWDYAPKNDRIEELIKVFGLSSSVAANIADGKGYDDVRKEAQRRLMAEAENPTDQKWEIPQT